MTLLDIIPWIQIAISVILVALVLLQRSDEGGLGGAFGGGSGGEGSYRTRRGFERIIFNLTIVLGISFGLLAIISLFLTA